ncbi:twitching motility protein PilT [Rhodococcoides trifolii]|uniref:Twitching motility protein PilT n=1 Tax=Rhodococcoides trifolii TaxID=908250 RepID=A0A917CVF5_9NOCA|nr:type II toxin-antitoxin system VapC family toxin [Rhodococcus trifolii]GGF99573.1 twitching motility protein PilT [Rhodococcus trifolii]
MTAVLLDTSALLWLVAEPERVRPSVLDLLEDPDTELAVSAISAWEIAIKSRNGRVNAGPLLQGWDELLASMNVTDLAIDSADSIAAGGMTWNHKDPFDRMIVAQAARRGLTVATSDRIIIEAELTPVLDTRRSG